MTLNRSDKSRILRRYFPGMTRNSEMSTEPRQSCQGIEYRYPEDGSWRRVKRPLHEDRSGPDLSAAGTELMTVGRSHSPTIPARYTEILSTKRALVLPERVERLENTFVADQFGQRNV